MPLPQVPHGRVQRHEVEGIAEHSDALLKLGSWSPSGRGSACNLKPLGLRRRKKGVRIDLDERVAG